MNWMTLELSNLLAGLGAMISSQEMHQEMNTTPLRDTSFWWRVVMSFLLIGAMFGLKAAMVA